MGIEVQERPLTTSSRASPVLKNVVITTIRPFEKTDHPASILPSIFDMNCVDMYAPVLMFYKSEKAVKFDLCMLVSRLKQSLSKVLVPYFPFAGVSVWNDTTVRELQCSDKGVPFIEAYVDEDLDSVVDIYDFKGVPQLMGNGLMGLDALAFNQNVDAPLPALFVQVTEFKCGAVALHASFLHQLVDGEGIFTFLKAWSQIALTDNLTNTLPVHDRSLTTTLAAFLASLGSAGADPPKEELNTEKTDPQNDVFKTPTRENDVFNTPTPRADPGAMFRLSPLELMCEKTLHVRRKVIEDLKREAAEKGKVVTIQNIIIAHLWRSISNLPESIDETTKSAVGIFVDGRNRFHSPPLPPTYTGNAVVYSLTPEISKKELTDQTILFAATLLRESLQSITPSNWPEVMGRGAYLLKNFTNLRIRHMMLTSWFRYPMYEISFDTVFGQPIYATSNLNCKLAPVGGAVILPPAPGLPGDPIASVQVYMQSKNGANESLFSDQQFLSFFH